MKYMTRMGQNTGMLKNSKNVHVIAITTALVAPYLQGENTADKFIKIKKISFFQIMLACLCKTPQDNKEWSVHVCSIQYTLDIQNGRFPDNAVKLSKEDLPEFKLW